MRLMLDAERKADFGIGAFHHVGKTILKIEQIYAVASKWEWISPENLFCVNRSGWYAQSASLLQPSPLHSSEAGSESRRHMKQHVQIECSLVLKDPNVMKN